MLLEMSSSNSIPFFICDTPKKPIKPIGKQQHDQINTHLPIPPGTFESMIFPNSRYRWHMFSQFPWWVSQHLKISAPGIWQFSGEATSRSKNVGFFETKHHRNQAFKNLFRHQGTVNTKSLPKSSSSTSTQMNSSKPSTENLIRIRLTTAVKLTRESSLLPSLKLYNSNFTPEDRLIFPQRKYVVWTNHPFSGALAAGFREGINLVFFVVFLLMSFFHPTHRCDEVNMWIHWIHGRMNEASRNLNHNARERTAYREAQMQTLVLWWTMSWVWGNLNAAFAHTILTTKTSWNMVYIPSWFAQFFTNFLARFVEQWRSHESCVHFLFGTVVELNCLKNCTLTICLNYTPEN